jgi:hypothetical protein
MSQWTKDQILAAAEAYEAERDKWAVRTNKAEKFPFQVIRIDDVPVVHLGARTHDVAIYEMEIKRGIAGMKAALAALEGKP